MSSQSCGDPLERSRRVLLLCSVGALAAAAWFTMWRWGGAGNGVLFHTHALHHYDFAFGNRVALVILGWTVMTLAMMLPTSLPILGLFYTIAGRRPDRVSLVVLAIAGYLAIWLTFGVSVFALQLAIERVIESHAWLSAYSWSGAPILFLAGAYQFTPLKYRCLEKCRSPYSFVVEHWQGDRERGQAFRLGLDHGLFCLGCCWALMLLMFVTGLGNIAWMFLLAAVMAVEKNVSWGKRVSAPLGVALVVASILLAVQAA
jgi:predicted metal-binding membrane protein